MSTLLSPPAGRQFRISFVLCFLLPWLMPAVAMAMAASPSELLNAGRADEAIRVLTPQATGNNAVAMNYLGRVYYALGDWDNAVRFCEHAALIEPNNAQFQLWLGRSYGEKASTAPMITAFALARKTAAAFLAARTLDKQSLEIARDWAEYLSTAPAIVGGGSARALALAAELESISPATAAWVRAMVASNNGKYEEAEREYLDSIRLDRNSAESQLEYARFLRGRKRWTEFLQVVKRAIETPSIRPVDRYDAAEMLAKDSVDLNIAALQMRSYIQSRHTVEDAPLFRAHYLLGEILLKSGDTGGAAAEYRAALALASSYRPAADALARLGLR